MTVDLSAIRFAIYSEIARNIQAAIAREREEVKVALIENGDEAAFRRMLIRRNLVSEPPAQLDRESSCGLDAECSIERRASEQADK